ncbi:uncharacterized protein LOC135810320 [Sycon ciliatum]|uniref:uncharacterized protein LOC135810320 n=1 Tax=Sycon ciliatum TaxID=27933 RepID=UPI0031F672E9
MAENSATNDILFLDLGKDFKSTDQVEQLSIRLLDSEDEVTRLRSEYITDPSRVARKIMGVWEESSRERIRLPYLYDILCLIGMAHTANKFSSRLGVTAATATGQNGAVPLSVEVVENNPPSQGQANTPQAAAAVARAAPTPATATAKGDKYRAAIKRHFPLLEARLRGKDYVTSLWSDEKVDGKLRNEVLHKLKTHEESNKALLDALELADASTVQHFAEMTLDCRDAPQDDLRHTIMTCPGLPMCTVPQDQAHTAPSQ